MSKRVETKKRAALLVLLAPAVNAFIMGPHHKASATTTATTTTATALSAAKPQRLDQNAPGVVYVNDRCIDCAACASFCPEVFTRHEGIGQHVVHTQPQTDAAISKARAALAACPVAAIRVETLPERRHAATVENKRHVQELWSELDETMARRMSLSPKLNDFGPPFPRPFLMDETTASTEQQSWPPAIPNVYWTGHHNEASFGAIPYLLKVKHGNIHHNNHNDDVWIMVDTPKYNAKAVQTVVSLTGPDGPDYLFLTHVDDTADHGLWKRHFGGNLKEIFHAGDLGRHNWVGDETLGQVDILLENKTNNTNRLTAYSLDGEVLPDHWQQDFERGVTDSDVVILHTPGHSPGSCTLYKRSSKNSPGILFTGDTYAYTTRGGGRMTGFGRYGNDVRQQVETLSKLLQLNDWSVIAPGHGHARDYRGQEASLKAMEMKQAQDDLLFIRRR